MLRTNVVGTSIAVLGFTLLLGPGSVKAQTIINLDAERPDPTVSYAVETLSDATAVTVDRATHYQLATADQLLLQVTTELSLAADSRYYLRLALSDGMVFSDGLTSAAFDQGDLVIGGPLDSVAVFSVRSDVARDSELAVNVANALAVRSREPATYSASLGLYRDLDKAYDGEDQVVTRFVGGSAEIVRLVSGIDAAITPDPSPAVADVATGYLSFVTRAGENFANPSLGTFRAIPRNARPAATDNVLSAVSGEPLPEAGQPLSLIAAGGVSVDLAGELSIGVWSFKAMGDAEGDPYVDDAEERESCPVSVGSEDDPVDPAEPGNAAGAGALAPDEDEPAALGMVAGLDAGVYALCVTVDTGGADSNVTPIRGADYEATVYALADGDDPHERVEVASGRIGSIVRNGANVSLTYLNVSGRYEQRIVILNRARRDAAYEIGEFAPAAGLAVEAGELASGTIGAGEMLVLPTEQVLSITGGGPKQTAAVLRLDVDGSDVSVATVQTNPTDNSTDTVVYATDVRVTAN